MSVEPARRSVAMQFVDSNSSNLSSSSSKEIPWIATDQLWHGEVIHSFLPLDDDNLINNNHKLSQKIIKNLKNIYVGEQVYIFETLKTEIDNVPFIWARGYTIMQPLPADYISASIDVKKLPDPNISISIFPLNCVKIISKSTINQSQSQNNNNSNNTFIDYNSSTFYDELDDYSIMNDSELMTSSNSNSNSNSINKIKKPFKPQLPLTDSTFNENLEEEIKLTLKTISSTLFAVYAKNNFEFFEKLSKIYYELDDIRTSLHYDILTKYEKTIAKKKVIFLMSKFSKLLSSGGGMINKAHHSKSDIDGKASIMARNEKTAELFNFPSNNESKLIDPAEIAQSQIISALSPNYLSSLNTSFIPSKNSQFAETIPSNIMVDFKEVLGSSNVLPKGYAGMKAYMYLRNTKKRLTEAFCINIEANQEIQLDNLAAALFTNIPAIEVESSRIYLVALLTETIHISDNENSKLPVIRKGICAGVADISRIFSNRKGHLVSGQSHRFVIKLFSSFLDSQKQEVKLFAGMNQMMAKSLTMVNNGWGELVDRIISGSSKGVAVNPRTERLILSIKELKLTNDNKKILNHISGNNGDFNNVAWACIPTLNFNPLEIDENRIYLKLNKIINKNLKLNEKSFLTVHVRSSNNSLKFAKGRNEKLLDSWIFLSVSPNESIQELIVIRGLSDRPDNGKDYLIFDLFLDETFICTTKYLLRSSNEVFDCGINSKTPINVELKTNDSISVANMEIDLEVVGKAYNRDSIGSNILNWSNIYGSNLTVNEDSFIDMLTKLKRIQLSTLVRFFPNFCYEIICAYDASSKLGLNKLKKSLFDALVHLFDATIIRNQEYVVLFDNMIKDCNQYYPKVGELLLESMTLIFSSFNKEWNANGRALCRTSYLVLKICSLCIKDNNNFKNQTVLFTKAITNFLDGNIENVLADQLLIIETLELYLDIMKPFFNSAELIKFSNDWIHSNKLKGLGSLEDSNSTALVNKKKNREHKFIIGKLFFINRLLNSTVFTDGNNNDIETLLFTALEMILNIFSSDVIDLDCSRLALGIYSSVINLTFGAKKIYTDESKKLYILLIKLLPFLSTTFNKYYSYCSNNGYFKKKRTFTQVFPNEYPFTEQTMDSIVTDVTLVEIIVDFSIIIVSTSKIFEIYENDFYQNVNNSNAGIYENLINKFDIQPFNRNTCITSILQTVKYLVDGKFYPHDSWLSLHSINLQGCYLILRLIEPFIPKADNNTIPMWNLYLTLLCKTASAKPVSIEHLEFTPKKGCLQLTTDLRSKLSNIINNSWDSLSKEASDENQARFQLKNFGGYQNSVMSMNNHKLLKWIMLFSMQRNESCLNIGVKIFWTLIANELVEKDSLFEFERETVSSLYELFENELTYSPQSNEISTYLASIQNIIKKMDVEDISYSEVNRLVKTLSKYLSSLVELRQVPNGEEFDDDRTFHKLNISSYLMNVDRPELFQGFICDMYENYLDKKNYVQAALSLELLANSWEWDINTYLPECSKPKLPSQTAFKRKVDLFKIIANNFIKGNKLEQAVDIYNEMLEAYSKYNFELMGLSFCHLELGKLYGELENVDRLESTFFKISFIGLGFPESIRGKEFIYEGLPYEHITSVHNRLNRLYPGSRIISNEDEANKLKSEENSPIGKYLFIKTVIPKKESFGSEKLSHMAKQYVDNKNLNTFINTRRLPGANSITNLWTEEITYTTYMTFPTLMNRSEIKNTNIIKIPPIKNAIRSLIIKNEELSNLEYLIKQNLKDNIKLESIASSSMFNSVSRILAGTVDSPVNGGAGQFKIFFNYKEEGSNIDLGESIEEYENDCLKLNSCFQDLIKIMNNLLKLHGLIIPDTLRLQHESLVELFNKNFQSDIEELKLDVFSELDYDELMKSLTNKNVYSNRHRGSGNNNSISNISSSIINVGKQSRPMSIHSHHGSINSQHGSAHGSRHGSRYGPMSLRTGTGQSSHHRQSLRDDEYDDATSRQISSLSKSKRNILNYK